jgi:hypothetical protein
MPPRKTVFAFERRGPSDLDDRRGRSGHECRITIRRESTMPNSNRRTRAVIALFAATMALATVIAPAAAAAPSQVTITSNMTFPGTGEPNFGDFTATGPAVDAGLICPSGDVLDIRYVFGGFRSDRGVQIQVVKAFVCDGSGETIYIKIQVHVNPDGTESFTWVVLDGTGPYGKLEGSGAGATINQTDSGNTNIYTGFLLH